MKRPAFVLICSFLLMLVSAGVGFSQVPLPVLLRITQAEDERRWDDELRTLLSHRNTAIRKRAALAAGRIGNEDSVPALVNLLKDADPGVRAMVAFALGEVESASAAEALIAIGIHQRSQALVTVFQTQPRQCVCRVGSNTRVRRIEKLGECRSGIRRPRTQHGGYTEQLC